MPEFLEDFANLVNSKKGELKEKILYGLPNRLENSFSKYFNSYWIPNPKNADTKSKVSKADTINLLSLEISNPILMFHAII